MSEDITDDTNPEFINAYEKFHKIVLKGDERIANILRCFLHSCNHRFETTNIDTIDRVRANLSYRLFDHFL